MCGGLHEYEHHTHAGAYGGHKRVSDHLDLQLEFWVTLWMLGTKPRFSAREIMFKPLSKVSAPALVFFTEIGICHYIV